MFFFFFSESVLCLGKVNQNPASNTVWEEKLSWFKDSPLYRTLETQLAESRWNSSEIFSLDSPHCRSSTKSRVHDQNGRPITIERNCETVDSHVKVWATGHKPHAAIARRGTNPSPASVDQTGSQPRVISESRCRAKLRGIFKQAQRHSRDGRFFLLVGGPARLVGGQISRLSSLGIVVLSGVLSPDFDLNSSTVRNVLRGWITHGDIAAVWMTQPFALSTVSSLSKACQQATIAGVYAATKLVTCIVPAKTLTFAKCRWICALLASISRNV